MIEKGHHFLIPKKSHTLLLSIFHWWELVIWPHQMSREFEKYGSWSSICSSATSPHEQWGTWIFGQLAISATPSLISILLSYSDKFCSPFNLWSTFFSFLFLGSNIIYQVFIICLFVLLLFTWFLFLLFWQSPLLTLHYLQYSLYPLWWWVKNPCVGFYFEFVVQKIIFMSKASRIFPVPVIPRLIFGWCRRKWTQWMFPERPYPRGEGEIQR